MDPITSPSGLPALTIPETPRDPFTLVPTRSLETVGRRTAMVFGAPVELVCLPGRRDRGGVPNDRRPTFLPNRAPGILREEEVWSAPGVIMTGNAFPFTDRQIVLWATERRREPSIEMLQVAYAMEDEVVGTTVVNSMGAAGSITRSHIHLLGATNEFFETLPKSQINPDLVGLDLDHLGPCELWRLDPPFPITAVGVRGLASERAQTMHHLLECRTTPAFNLIGSHRTSWLVPRSRVEMPAPHFRQALGGAELWGRWCYIDTEAFEQATAAALESAIRMVGVPWP